MEDLMKVPDEVIIKQLQEEVKALRKKNHEVCTKAKERETQWKAYTEELLNTIRVLEEDNDEEKKLRREVKAMKKMNEDYNQLLTQHNNVVERYKVLKLQVKELKSELEGKPMFDNGPSRIEMRKKFNKIKNQRDIMNEMCFAYNESMPIAYNVVVFLEWVRVSGKWDELYARMYNVYTE